MIVFSFFLGRFLGRVLVLFLVFLFSWSLSWSSSCFLVFLIPFLVEFLFSWSLSWSSSCFLTFLFSSINSHLSSIKQRCHHILKLHIDNILRLNSSLKMFFPRDFPQDGPVECFLKLESKIEIQAAMPKENSREINLTQLPMPNKSHISLADTYSWIPRSTSFSSSNVALIQIQ